MMYEVGWKTKDGKKTKGWKFETEQITDFLKELEKMGATEITVKSIDK